jgi:predicted N-acetyltransferase YhbS
MPGNQIDHPAGERVAILPAETGDAPAILELQKLAYLSEARIYDDYSLPPLHQTLEQLVADITGQTVLKAVLDGRIVGSVRARLDRGTCFIGRLIVEPELQNQGIGTTLMLRIHDHFAQAERFELFTGVASERPLHLYRKLGYRACRTERQTDKVEIVFMERSRPEVAPAD